ncbi:MAG: hypothetical protein ACI9JN_000621 [Bacteroidia bacterium]|jgi:hypothetical protein
MAQSLLFIPDISGFTNFVQTTEAEHSQHVISELLEILISSNTIGLQLAEVEGDALFFYKKHNIPTREHLLAQIEAMYASFYSHLKLLEKNRICTCNACAMAPKLELKIVAHCGEIQYLNVQGKKKPFGQSVIETHRLLKNNIQSDNYIIISTQLAQELKMPLKYKSNLYTFIEGVEYYDNKEITFIYSEIDNSLLKLLPFESPEVIEFNREPNLTFKIDIDVNANEVLEIITNYKYRASWVKGVDKFEYNESEVTRLGSEHVCVINGKHFNFKTVTKKVDDDELVYGEITDNPRILDRFYQFYIIKPLANNKSTLTSALYWIVTSPINKLIVQLFAKNLLKKSVKTSLTNLKKFAEGLEQKG